MTRGGRFKGMLLLAAAGVVAAAGGCSKLQASLDRQDTVTLGDVAARVAALEQRVADLETGNVLKETQAGTVDTPGAADIRAEGRVDANRIAQGTQAVVTASFLNVRERPDAQSTKIGTLKEGAVVQVLGLEGDWARIRFGRSDSGLTGWVSQQFLQRQE